MTKPTDIRVVGTKLYLLPTENRIPRKFGHEIVTSVTCARACVTVADTRGRRAEGWGETPLGVQWAWPGGLPYEQRHQAFKQFCLRLAEAWADIKGSGHALGIGHNFQEENLPVLLARFNQQNQATVEPMPSRAALLLP